MRKEEILLDERFGKEYAGRYVFTEITWAKRNRIIQKHTRYSPQTGQVVSSDYVAIQAETILASLREQPKDKPVTLEILLGEDEGVPAELGELFSRIVNQLNTVGVDETSFLSEPSADRNRIKSSQTLDSARNSDGRPSSLNSSQPESSNNS
jgi:hypothetical protein